MKDQYFGDINDYRKYGLLRAIIGSSELRILIAWMLTKDDGSSDGKFISYLEEPKKWSHYDADLFQGMQNLLAGGHERQVSLIEKTDLLPGAEYFSGHVPDAISDRKVWFYSLTQKAHSKDFIFLDPDIGLEVKSKRYGHKGSSKYVYWHEVASLWSLGKSLLIYQHFTREKRNDFIQRMLVTLRKATPGSLVEAFSTSHVVFFMALQPNHHELNTAIVNSIQTRWKGQICLQSATSGDRT